MTVLPGSSGRRPFIYRPASRFRRVAALDAVDETKTIMEPSRPAPAPPPEEKNPPGSVITSLKWQDQQGGRGCGSGGRVLARLLTHLGRFRGTRKRFSPTSRRVNGLFSIVLTSRFAAVGDQSDVCSRSVPAPGHESAGKLQRQYFRGADYPRLGHWDRSSKDDPKLYRA